MRLLELKIENYKSLREACLRPNDLTVIVGANGSGKTNIASAFGFLAEAYENGLEYAVLNRGGFENIAYRRQRRTKSAIQFTADFIIDASETQFFMWVSQKKKQPLMRVKHKFAFKALKQDVNADYSIDGETIEVFVSKAGQSAEQYSDFSPYLRIERNKNGVSGEAFAKKEGDYSATFLDYLTKRPPNPLELIGRQIFFSIQAGLGGMSVHQFSPQVSRTPAPPSTAPRLTSYGQNLPALVNWLQRNHKVQWDAVEQSMREIIPGIESIKTDFSTNNYLTLSFKEKSSNRFWTANDVSDGTIQTLSILCCLVDPRTTLLFLEEPENSVHPWIVRQIAAQLKKHSKVTQVILTTHSPIIMNVVTPEQVWICHKENGETFLSHLPISHPEVVKDWDEGENRLFDLFDLGLVEEAMPKGQIV